ncbi:MAG: peptide-methionine (S)-S-oxide reductase MsrA [Paracoccus marcusii]|uniref:Peptide methionine sulfoxide reductase MsrA n=1 Tax=Paracoccus marcusii TaxID=59779 RepID=A0ABY7UVE4_9RHOB|nr:MULTISPECIES: peptide-methionine (S)-S-oxide reductase MsrA [Paracoccus]TYP67632.1 peptide-methionine (S)-S-oxide reductase [Stutzerimonas stutzeri]AZY92897.1 peptide-methionine (S)-S-oxide reductase MsrA [Paracoccus sp. Arc7-R13]MBF5079393.1 peptide-methionine (S)-S-oxide reductase MsrA [Paracoccus sp. NBH48]MCO6362322.1 peptide-methionine (S)-S-oxide reductase MsrA [Paracoccus sp. 08]QXI65050.1 Peptide methionine sulfoxide reductase MsrA [Paracoccus marcusii]
MTDHAIFHRPLGATPPAGYDQAIFGMGCYWGVERLFWKQNGVWLTEVGFAGGDVQNPTYDQVKRGDTGHAEVVRVIYDSSLISYDHLLQLFWENHDPTQGDRQGNDVGNQYRSLIMTFTDLQESAAEASKIDYDNRLAVQGMDKITTQIVPAGPFWPAHEAHQQYLEKNPDGYCGLKGTGVQASIPNPDPI